MSSGALQRRRSSRGAADFADLMSSQPATFDALPDEVWALVFQRLAVREIARCTEVCRLWNNIIKRDIAAWRPHVTEHGLLDPRTTTASPSLRTRLHNYIRYLRDGSFTDFVDHHLARPYRVARVAGNVVQGLFLFMMAVSMFMLQSPAPVLLGFVACIMLNGAESWIDEMPKAYRGILTTARGVAHLLMTLASLVGLIWSWAQFGFSIDTIWIDAFALSMQTSPLLFRLGEQKWFTELVARFNRYTCPCNDRRRCHGLAELCDACGRVMRRILEPVFEFIGNMIKRFLANAFRNVFMHIGSLMQSSMFQIPSALVPDFIIVGSCLAAFILFVWYFYWPIFLVAFSILMLYAFVLPSIIFRERMVNSYTRSSPEEDTLNLMAFALGAVVLRLWLWLWGAHGSIGLQIGFSAMFWWAQSHTFFNIIGGRFEAAYTIIFWVLAPLRFWILIPSSLVLIAWRVFFSDLGVAAITRLNLTERKSPMARLHDSLQSAEHSVPAELPDSMLDGLARYSDTPAVQRIIAMQTLRQRWHDVEQRRLTSFRPAIGYTGEPLGLFGDNWVSSGFFNHNVAAGGIAAFRAMNAQTSNNFMSGAVGRSFVCMQSYNKTNSVHVYSLPQLFPIDELIGVPVCGVCDNDVLFVYGDTFIIKTYPTQIEREVEFEGAIGSAVSRIGLGRFHAALLMDDGKLHIYDRRTGSCRFTKSNVGNDASIRFGPQFSYLSESYMTSVIDSDNGIVVSTTSMHGPAAIEAEFGFAVVPQTAAIQIYDLLHPEKSVQTIDCDHLYDFSRSQNNRTLAVSVSPTRILIKAAPTYNITFLHVIDMLYDDGAVRHTSD